MIEFSPKLNIVNRYSIENMAKTLGLTVDEFLQNNIIEEEYRQKCIQRFIDNGMDRCGAELQTCRKMNGFH